MLATGGDDRRINLWVIGKPNALMVSKMQPTDLHTSTMYMYVSMLLSIVLNTISTSLSLFLSLSLSPPPPPLPSVHIWYHLTHPKRCLQQQ